jgi:hypothetical protein
VKLVCGGEIKFAVWLYDVPARTAAGGDLKLGVLPNLELFGEAHIDTSAWELSDRRRPGPEALAERRVVAM